VKNQDGALYQDELRWMTVVLDRFQHNKYSSEAVALLVFCLSPLETTCPCVGAGLLLSLPFF